MGYSYIGRALACDSCGQAGGVRKRTCPYTVVTDSLHGRRITLHWCTPPAVCPRCWPTVKGRLHVNCKDAAAADQRRCDEVEAGLTAGRKHVRSALGGLQHPSIAGPAVRATFLGLNGQGEVEYFIPDADYDPNRRPWLDEYPNAVPAIAPEPVVDEAAIGAMFDELLADLDAAPPPPAVKVGDLVITWYDDKPVTYGGPCDDPAFTQVAFGLGVSGRTRYCELERVAPADTPIPDKDDRVNVAKAARKPYAWAPGLWQLKLPVVETSTWHATKRDATADGLRQLAILDWHAKRSALVAA